MGLIRKEDLHESLLNSLSNPNLLINGDFQVWQRGTQFNNSSEKHTQYTADRWVMWSNKNAVVSNGEGWHLKWVSGGNDDLIQVVELPKSAINSQMVLSFSIYVEDGVSISYGVNNGTSINGSDKTQEVTRTYIGKGYWETVVLIIPSIVPTNSKLRVYFKSRQNSEGKTIKLAKIKLELGSVATPFVPRLFAEELALCQRYYQRLSIPQIPYVTDPNQIEIPIKLHCSMRKSPTLKWGKPGYLHAVNGSDVKTLCSNVDTPEVQPTNSGGDNLSEYFLALIVSLTVTVEGGTLWTLNGSPDASNRISHPSFFEADAEIY